MSSVDPVFARANGILAADVRDDVLFVEAVRELEPQSLKALEFATGCTVRVTVVPTRAYAEDRTPNARGAPPNFALASATIARANATSGRSSPSLAQLAFGSAGRPHSFQATIHAVARLLDAGYSAQVLRLTPGSPDLAASFGQGVTYESDTLPGPGSTLTEWINGFRSAPRWIKAGLAACHDDRAQSDAIVAIDRILARGQSWRQSVFAAILPLLIAWMAIAAFWAMLSWPVALGILVLGAIAGVRTLHVLGGRPRDDAVRAQVLRIVALMARLEVAPAMAIHVAGLRMSDISPTWGQPPETRESLARMLELDAVDALVLMKGDLESASHRLAEECEARALSALSLLCFIGKLGLSLIFAASLIASLS